MVSKLYIYIYELGLISVIWIKTIGRRLYKTRAIYLWVRAHKCYMNQNNR